MARRQLAQVTPATSTTVTAFSLSSASPFTIDLVNIVNVSTGAVAVSLYHDSDGAVFTKDTALIYEHTLQAGEVLAYEHVISGYTSVESVGIQSSVSGGATFTMYGTVMGERL